MMLPELLLNALIKFAKQGVHSLIKMCLRLSLRAVQNLLSVLLPFFHSTVQRCLKGDSELLGRRARLSSKNCLVCLVKAERSALAGLR